MIKVGHYLKNIFIIYGINMKYKFYVYKIIGKAEVVVQNKCTQKEAVKLLCNNVKNLNYTKPKKFYVITDRKLNV